VRYPRYDILDAARRFHERVRRSLRRATLDPHAPVSEGEGDVIFRVDEVAEVHLHRLARDLGRIAPTRLLAEGPGEIRSGRGTPEIRVLVDPIDGSREITFGLGSAWVLLGAAEEGSRAPRLSDLFLAYQGEIPLPRAPTFRVLWAVGGRPPRIEIRDERTGRLLRSRPFRSDASARPGVGFHVFVRFGLDDRKPLARIETEFLRRLRRTRGTDLRLLGDWMAGPSARLLLDAAEGRVRMAADLRPLLSRARDGAFAGAKPYDVVTAPLFQHAGSPVTDLEGRPFDAPLDLETPVGYVAYPNERVRRTLEPLLLRALR